MGEKQPVIPTYAGRGEKVPDPIRVSLSERSGEDGFPLRDRGRFPAAGEADTEYERETVFEPAPVSGEGPNPFGANKLKGEQKEAVR